MAESLLVCIVEQELNMDSPNQVPKKYFRKKLDYKVHCGILLSYDNSFYREYQRRTLAQTAQISLFLSTLKGAIGEGKFVTIGREKNNEFMAKHGMTPREREEILYGLQVKDYDSGPE